MGITRALFKAARLSADARAVSRGRAGQRVTNRLVGRALARAGFWRRLWR